uniref:Methane oxygenase PmoA n=1 Tax=Schlesneria paludicola TaxID=360056 RepID=A0A7C4LQ19_9PLAN
MSPLFPRCEWTPLPDYQVQGTIDGEERVRWHYGAHYPRPFFFPLRGPSGRPLTRMGHPGAPDHDHHRSIWFAHHKVLGINFWADRQPATIRQQDWLAYIAGDAEAILAVQLGWYDGHDPQPLLTQQLFAALRPGPAGETLLELQSTFMPHADQLEFGQTNFGFLAVRVARSLSAVFGGGQLIDSEGRRGEPAIFGQRAAWMDYSGPVAPDVIEGITFFDHPSNPGYPTHWHVRDDGWMGAAVCLAEPRMTTRNQPLALRYLLHAHAGAVQPPRAHELARAFASAPRLILKKSSERHRTFAVAREE